MMRKEPEKEEKGKGSERAHHISWVPSRLRV